MEKLTLKIVAIMLITILSIALIPTNAFAVNDNIKIVKANTDYIIYVKDMANKEFKFATSDGATQLDPSDISLNYINAVQDDEGNNVALVNETAKFLYIKEGTNTSAIELDLSQAIDKNTIADIEKTTNKIKTETTTINQRNEQVDQVKYEVTVGGLKITDDQDATYEYVIQKLPSEGYTELKQLANELNNDYESKDMYSKIQFAKDFASALNNLTNKADNENTWKPVENMQIIQPDDAQNGEEYVVLIKQTKGQEVKYDVKLLTSSRTESEPEEKSETIVTKRTSKLPITGDNLILFVILAVIIIALVIVYIRMRKINKGKH